MELVSIARVLWRRRLVVGLGALLAVASALIVGGGSEPHQGVALTRVVLDTPKSQLVHPAPSGADSLAWRAELLADLMASRPGASRIARDLRIPENQLVVVNPVVAEPAVPASLARRAAEVAAATPEPYILAVRYEEPLPIISIETAAPDRARATRLAEAATRVLKAFDSPVGTPQVQGFVVETLRPIRAKELGGGSGLLMALATGIFLFGAWCMAVVLAPGLVRVWRGASPIHAPDSDPLSVDEGREASERRVDLRAEVPHPSTVNP